MKQTAVDWLISDLISKRLLIIRGDTLRSIDQAKAMEKEQMLDIYVNHNQYNDNFLGFDDYYNETYKSE